MTKKILFILMPDNYRDEEFFEPYNMLVNKGYSVDVAGFKPGDAIGTNKYKFTPNLLLENLGTKDFDKYDALVIPGGPTSKKYLWKNEDVLKIIKYFNTNKKIVAAICYAVIALVDAGILTNKKATVSPTPEAKNIFETQNVIFLPDGCVTLESEKIITAQGPAYCKHFGQAIIELL